MYQRKDGRWEARLSKGVINGKRQSRSFYGKSKEEAEQKMISHLYSCEDISSVKLTVAQLCTEWLAVVKHRIKVSTLANYRMKIEKHIIPSFGEMMCGEFNSKSISIFIQQKLDSGLSSRYVCDILVLMKSIFKYARQEYRLPNPFDTVSMPRCTKPQIRLLNRAEQTKLKSFLSRHQSPITLGVVLALSMGLRVGEVCGLMWQDIDFEKRILTVRRTVQRVAIYNGIKKSCVMIMPPKSESSIREIPIPSGVFVMLKNLRSANENYIISGKTTPAEPRKMQYHFAKILKNVNLPSVRFHSLRHAFASNAVEKGFDIKTLSEILGHSKVELTMNLYVHSNIDRKRTCMKLMEWSA